MLAARFGTALDDAPEAGDDGVPFASLHWSDGARHRELRNALAPLASTEGVREEARRVARERFRSAFDLVDDFALHIARAVARPRLGIDEAHLEEALDLARAEAHSHHAANPERAWRAASQRLVELCRDQIARGKRSPRETRSARGILGKLVDDGVLPHESGAYILRFIATTLAETTTLAIAGSLVHVVRMREAIKDADEMLRVLSPVARFGRVATDDTELDGVVVPRGARVIMSFAAANHDPDVFTNPRRARPRSPNPHVAFGVGPHVCLGAPVARATLAGVLDEVVDDAVRTLDVVELVPLRSTVNRGVKRARVGPRGNCAP